MQFPNAFEGVKKIYKAEIIALIGAICGLVAAILGLIGAAAGSVGGLAGAGVLIIAMSVLLIIAFIINIGGLNKAKADEEYFAKALYMVIAGIVLSVVMGATKEGTLLHTVGDGLSKLCSLLVNYLVATALLNLAERMGNGAVAQKAKSVRSLLTVVWIIALVLDLVGGFLTTTEAVVAVVLALIASIVEIIAYILYLGLLSKARGMLEQ